MTGNCFTKEYCVNGADDGLVGYYIEGTCPDCKPTSSFGEVITTKKGLDPDEILCCIVAGCSSPSSTGQIGFGWCMNTEQGCDEGFVAGRCPGPVDVQCC